LAAPWSNELGATDVAVGDWTVTEPLAPLVFYPERQAAITW
jgi:hypothetical protein